MKKDLHYYMNLPYKIEITPIPEGLGGGYSACLPEIGAWTVIGSGDTIMEAIEGMTVIKKITFCEYLKGGVKIPEPEPMG